MNVRVYANGAFAGPWSSRLRSALVLSNRFACYARISRPGSLTRPGSNECHRTVGNAGRSAVRPAAFAASASVTPCRVSASRPLRTAWPSRRRHRRRRVRRVEPPPRAVPGARASARSLFDGGQTRGGSGIHVAETNPLPGVVLNDRRFTRSVRRYGQGLMDLLLPPDH